MAYKYYQKHKEKIRTEVRERYQNLFEEEEKRRKMARDRYQNLSEEKKGKKRQYHRGRNKNIFQEQRQIKLSI